MAHPRPRWTTAGRRLTRPGWLRSISTHPIRYPRWVSGRWLGSTTPQLAGDVLSTAAGPDSPVAMIELRNVGNSAPARDGAITTVPGPFLLHAVGLAADPSLRAATEQRLKRVYTAAQPADVGLAAASFAEGRAEVVDGLQPAGNPAQRNTR